MDDVVVAGGGPAGLAAAIHGSLAGLRVVVVEPEEGVIDKACGEGIMPHGVSALRALGLGGLPYGRPFVGVRYVDASDPELVAEGSFPAGVNGIGVRRTVLHGWLRDRARRLGVRFARTRFVRFEDRGDHVVVACESEDLPARWLIGADGRRSKVRAQLGVSRSPSLVPRLGVRCHYEMAPWSDRVEVHFADGAEAYVTPVAANLVGVAILFERARGSFDELLRERFPGLAARLSGATVKSKTRGAGPFEQRVARRVKGNVLLVGDAAGYLDPLTGDGIALGLQTAAAAIRHLVGGTLANYESAYDSLTARHVALTSALLRVAHHRSLHRAFLKLARATPSVFDAVLKFATCSNEAEVSSEVSSDERVPILTQPRSAC